MEFIESVTDQGRGVNEGLRLAQTMQKKPKKELEHEKSMLIIKIMTNNDGKTLRRVKKGLKGVN